MEAPNLTQDQEAEALREAVRQRRQVVEIVETDGDGVERRVREPRPMPRLDQVASQLAREVEARSGSKLAAVSNTGCLLCDRPLDWTVANVPWMEVGGLCEQHSMAVLSHHAETALGPLPKVHMHRKPTPDALLIELQGWVPTAGGVYLHGPQGRGKSFQAVALAMKAWTELARRSWTRPTIVWRGVPSMLIDIQSSFGSKKRYDPGPARTCDLLVLDNLASSMNRGSDWAQSIIFDLVNYRYEAGLPMIVTSLLDLGELARGYNREIASRFAECCRQVPFTGPDLRKTLTPFSAVDA